MSAFDACITEISTRIDAMRARAAPQVHDAHHPEPPAELIEGLPMRIGPGANPAVILRGDTFVELGNPEAGSCAVLLWTEDLSLVVDGRITLLGPDVGEAEGASLPFAQVLIIGGPELGSDDHEALVGLQNVSDRVEGFMAKSTSEYVWARVSREGAAKGFNLDALGRALLYLVKTDMPKVRAAEVAFVTTSRDDVRSLADVATTAKQIGASILKETWKARGFDLDCDVDCSSCSDQEICDDIRDVIVVTKRKTRRSVS